MSLSGKEFNPDDILEKINGQFLTTDKFSKTDKTGFNDNIYGYGNLTVYHKNDHVTDMHMSDYEMFYVKFIIENQNFLIDNNVKEIELFYDLFYDGGQCNFQISSINHLKKLSTKLKVSIPISIHKISQREMKCRIKEINKVWGKSLV